MKLNEATSQDSCTSNDSGNLFMLQDSKSGAEITSEKARIKTIT